MNTRRIAALSLTVLFVLVNVVSTPPAKADFMTGQARDVVNAFNSLNDGRGYHYAVSPSNGTWRMTTVGGYEQADFNAYSPQVGGPNFALTFCVEPDVGTQAKQFGTLSYENGYSMTQSGDKLTVGAASLYASFATGALDGYDYDSPGYSSDTELKNAIQYLIGAITGESWTGNDFLAGLLEINDDQSYWSQVYDPDSYYDEIGDYSVFVMNNRDANGTHAQDFLYLAAHESRPDASTPEPASMLIFGAGLGGLALARRMRKKQA